MASGRSEPSGLSDRIEVATVVATADVGAAVVVAVAVAGVATEARVPLASQSGGRDELIIEDLLCRSGARMRCSGLAFVGGAMEWTAEHTPQLRKCITWRDD